ncbi:MAG: WYL domain-containing protein [Bacilli bacterium]|nr:WYL domain-containing protein [Bacilli bacterium]
MEEKNYHEKNGNALYIINILKKYSNEEHKLSIQDIIKYVEDIYGVKNDRRTLERNIDLLINKLDYDIEIDKVGNKNYYYLINNPENEFEPGEIRTIIDTFSYATFVPEVISNGIIDKCKNMQNIYEAEKLKNYKIYSNNIKTNNMEIIKNIEDIQNAIYNKLEISFDYYKYELNPILKSVKVDTYKISPYAIIYSIQELYLIALKQGENELKTFRIDRIKNISILDTPSKKISESRINEIVKSSISMYGGKGSDIEVICDNKLLDNVIEVFGKDIDIKKYDNNHFKLKMNKDIEGFKYYVLRNIEYIDIIKPIELKNEINKILNDYLGR